MFEEFVEVVGFPRYRVSRTGEVLNISTNRILRITENKKNGWAVVGLMGLNGQHTVSVAKMVALAYLDEPEEPHISVLHRDGDRMNCNVENLMWRPRWFVVHYMREMSFPRYQARRPFMTERTRLVFEKVVDFSYEMVELPSTIQQALFEGYSRLSFGIHGRISYIK